MQIFSRPSGASFLRSFLRVDLRERPNTDARKLLSVGGFCLRGLLY